MKSKIITKDNNNLLIEWEDNQKGFGQLSMKWDDEKKVYLLDSEFMGIDTVLKIIEAVGIAEKETKEDFIEKIRRSKVSLNPLVNCGVELLRQGEDVYKVMELLMTKFVEKDKQQFEIMKQLVEKLPISAGIKTEKQ